MEMRNHAGPRAHTLITMNIYWFGLAFMWNALHPIVSPRCCSASCRKR